MIAIALRNVAVTTCILALIGCTGKPVTEGTYPDDCIVTHDLGDCLAGSIASHAFRFKNETSEPIEIAGDATVHSCGCTKYSIDQHTLEPNKFTAVVISVDTSRKSGAFSEQVTCAWKTKSGRLIRRTFRIGGNALPPLRLSPNELVFSGEDVRTGCTKTVSIHSDLPIDWGSLNLKPLHPSILCTPRKSSRTSEGLVDISVDCESVNGAVMTGLEIAAQLQGGKAEDEPLIGTLNISIPDVTLLKVSPSTIYLHRVEGGFKGMVIVSGPYSDGLSMDSVEMNVDGGDVRLINAALLSATVARFDFVIESAAFDVPLAGTRLILEVSTGHSCVSVPLVVAN